MVRCSHFVCYKGRKQCLVLPALFAQQKGQGGVTTRFSGCRWENAKCGSDYITHCHNLKTVHRKKQGCSFNELGLQTRLLVLSKHYNNAAMLLLGPSQRSVCILLH